MSTFAFGSEFTVGMEEELLLVDPETLQLAPVAGDVLEAMHVHPEDAGHEAYAAQIELRSPPAESASDAAVELAGLRTAALEAGATLMASGLHPTGRFGDAELVPTERYVRVAGEMRGILRRTPESALHVHVGMPDGESAVSAFNALRRQVPLLLGLSANSPWWFGVDSGLASARYALVRAYPGRGIPEALRDLADAEERVAAVLDVAGVPEPTFLWWDLRLHPAHGTLEVREMDVQSSLESSAALAALVRSLALEAQDVSGAPRDPSELLNWSAFRAGRDGTDATILDDGRLRPLRHVARQTIDRLRPLARESGDADALDAIARILERGGGAGRQRSAHAGGGICSMLRTLVDDTVDVSLARPRAGRR
jgi:glutamate---cysteine ligase / carboxylate-amine ligase